MELIPIEDKIYEIRGRRVMLDFDLAEMYGIENKYLKRSVRSNIERFEGDDFMFEITKDELLRCQIGTLNIGRGAHLKYMPFAFTELGVAMLSSVLNSVSAIDTNRKIMRLFVATRHLVLNAPVDEVQELKNEVKELKNYLEDVFSDYNDINEDTRTQIELINEALAKLEVKHAYVNRPRRRIGFIQEKDDGE